MIVGKRDQQRDEEELIMRYSRIIDSFYLFSSYWIKQILPLLSSFMFFLWNNTLPIITVCAKIYLKFKTLEYIHFWNFISELSDISLKQFLFITFLKSVLKTKTKITKKTKVSWIRPNWTMAGFTRKSWGQAWRWRKTPASVYHIRVAFS